MCVYKDSTRAGVGGGGGGERERGIHKALREKKRGERMYFYAISLVLYSIFIWMCVQYNK